MKLFDPLGYLTLSFWQDWSEWFTREYNWYNFSLIAVELEYTSMRHLGPFSEIEISLAFFGLHLHISYCPKAKAARWPTT